MRARRGNLVLALPLFRIAGRDCPSAVLQPGCCDREYKPRRTFRPLDSAAASAVPPAGRERSGAALSGRHSRSIPPLSAQTRKNSGEETAAGAVSPDLSVPSLLRCRQLLAASRGRCGGKAGAGVAALVWAVPMACPSLPARPGSERHARRMDRCRARHSMVRSCPMGGRQPRGSEFHGTKLAGARSAILSVSDGAGRKCIRVPASAPGDRGALAGIENFMTQDSKR